MTSHRDMAFFYFFEKFKEIWYNVKRNRDTGNGQPQ